LFVKELIIFSAAFASVFLGCFQAVNVVRGRYGWAVVTSVAQSLAALTLYRLVPDVTTLSAGFAFVIAGVFGGQASMFATRRSRHGRS
jgi:hypothetical protein